MLLDDLASALGANDERRGANIVIAGTLATSGVKSSEWLNRKICLRVTEMKKLSRATWRLSSRCSRSLYDLQRNTTIEEEKESVVETKKPVQ
jgi:hypothetical protein